MYLATQIMWNLAWSLLSGESQIHFSFSGKVQASGWSCKQWTSSSFLNTCSISSSYQRNRTLCQTGKSSHVIFKSPNMSGISFYKFHCFTRYWLWGIVCRHHLTSSQLCLICKMWVLAVIWLNWRSEMKIKLHLSQVLTADLTYIYISYKFTVRCFKCISFCLLTL